MIKVAELSKHLMLRPDGTWTTDSNEDISYTKDGHRKLAHVQHDSFWFEHRSQCLEATLSGHPLDSPVLDVGGGNGSFSLFLQSHGLDTLLLEPGREGVENARLDGVKHVLQGSLLKARFQQETFAALVALDVLEHIQDHEQFVQEMYRIMRPSGRLVLTVPALEALRSAFDDEVGHFRRYSLRSLSHMLEEQGFEVEYKTYMFSMLPIPMLVLRKLIKQKKRENGNNLKGHIRSNSIAGRLLKPFLTIESFLIGRKIRIPIGSSCMIVARKSGIDG